MDFEKLTPHGVAEGGTNDGHRVEHAQEEGRIFCADVLVDVRDPERVEGRGARPVQQVGRHKHKLQVVVAAILK